MHALQQVTIRIIASLGPQMGPQAHFVVYVRVGDVVNLLQVSVLFGIEIKSQLIATGAKASLADMASHIPAYHS